MAVNRRLVAVVVADVVGYSRLMERDEAGTHERLRALDGELIRPKVAEHGGRVVKTSGDGMLLEFPSATSALRCAVEVQREMGVRNLYVAADEKIEFRIGINLGDIIVDGDDIVGDGVNVAARLETLAEPGGVCVAAAIREQVKENLGVEFTSLGEQRVKNISKPVWAFRVGLAKGAAPAPPAMEPVPRRRGGAGARRKVALTATGVAVIAAAAVAWRALPPVSGGDSKAGVPPLHSVMVVPIAATDDPALANAAARLTADLTRALGDSMRDMQVTTANAAAAIVARTTDSLAAGREANVRYLIEGDLRPSGEQVAVGVRLVDARDGRKIRYENRVVERAAVDDRDALVRSVAYASRIMLREELARETVKSSGATAVSAQDVVDRIFALSISDPVQLARETRRLSDEAIRLDPNFAQAWAMRASSSVDLFENDFSIGRERVLAEADIDSLRAVGIDPRSANAWWVRARVLDYLGNTDAAVAANERAHDLDPTRISPVILRGWIALGAGRPADALKVVDSLQALVASTVSEPNELACAAHLALGAYDEAITACERASASDSSFWTYLKLTSAYAMRGDRARAEEAKSRMLRLRPEFTIARYEAKRFTAAPAAVEQERIHLIAGLRKAGVPE
jgi:adenylate cyclase